LIVAIGRLLEIMARLRDPERGCPWDREQTWASIAPHTIEEAYELADAVRQGDPVLVRDELGDLLFQVVFQSRIAEEQGHFDFDAVAATISDKLERRHPHVFADAAVASVADQSRAWDAHKAAERRAQGQGDGALDGVTLALPALTRATKLGSRAGRVGFDWQDATGVLAKVQEEVQELQEAVQELGAASIVRADAASGVEKAHVTEELGDLLFALAQTARHLGIDAEAALRDANAKFERRFRDMEAQLAAQGGSVRESTPEALEALWAQAKLRVG
jgi:MazG family protein